MLYSTNWAVNIKITTETFTDVVWILWWRIVFIIHNCFWLSPKTAGTDALTGWFMSGMNMCRKPQNWLILGVRACQTHGWRITKKQKSQGTIKQYPNSSTSKQYKDKNITGSQYMRKTPKTARSFCPWIRLIFMILSFALSDRCSEQHESFSQALRCMVRWYHHLIYLGGSWSYDKNTSNHQQGTQKNLLVF